MPFLALAFFLSTYSMAEAEVYKWVDENGSVHFSDQPHDKIVKDDGDDEQAVEEEEKGKSKKPATKTDKKKKKKKKKKRKKKSKGVYISKGIKFGVSDGGLAVLTAKVKNKFPYPVDGVNLDVILYSSDREKIDINIPLTTGTKRPDWLEPGESAMIEYETELTPEQVAGHKYRLNWNSYQIVEPGDDADPGDNLPEGVIHKQTIPGKPKPAEPEPVKEKQGS